MIDYKLLDDSIKHYEHFGFKRIESPWTVTKAISDITKPDGKEDFFIKQKNKVLVGSGEQSFLYLYLKGFLPKGKFQTITPCFREEVFDELHTKYFIKNELIITDEVNLVKLHETIDASFDFFQAYFPKEELKVIKTGNKSFDIEIDGHELGSYGIRECSFLKWIYGTGCAEPRTSNLIKQYEE